MELIDAIFKAGVPVAAVSFMLFFYSLKKGQFTETGNTKRLKEEIKAYKKTKSHKQKTGNILHDKWMKFGGGFYGVMAFWTYIAVEMLEVWDFFEGTNGISDLLGLLTLSSLFNLLIDSVLNFITAITWPFYWMDILGDINKIMWLIVVYVGYSIGMNYGRHKAHFWHINKQKNKGEDDEVTKAKLFKNPEYLSISVVMAISAAFLFMPLDQGTSETKISQPQMDIEDDR